MLCKIDLFCKIVRRYWNVFCVYYCCIFVFIFFIIFGFLQCFSYSDEYIIDIDDVVMVVFVIYGGNWNFVFGNSVFVVMGMFSILYFNVYMQFSQILKNDFCDKFIFVIMFFRLFFISMMFVVLIVMFVFVFIVIFMFVVINVGELLMLFFIMVIDVFVVCIL